MQSITERLSNKPDAVQQASTPQLRVQNDSHKRVRPICVRCCLYMYQVPCLTCSTHGAQPQTLACSLLALSSRAARSHAGRHHAALTVSRQGASHSTPRVYSSVMLTLVRLVPMATAAAAQGSQWPRKSSTTADLSCVGRHSRRLERARPRHSNAACVSWHAQSGMLSQAPADNTGDGNMQREAKAQACSG